MKKNKIAAITIMSMFVGCSSLALADGFNPQQFQAQQVMNMSLEQTTLMKTVTQSIDDLHAFLKKNGIDNKDNKGGNDKAESPFSTAPREQAPAPQMQNTYQSKLQAPSKSTTPTPSNNNNLPLNTNSNNEQTSSWKYKL